MRAVLIRPSNPSGSAYLTKFGFLPAPLSLLQLAGVLRSEGWEARILDMEADPLNVERAVDHAVEFDPDLVGLTLHATAAHGTAGAIARAIKARSPDAMLVAGGHHATFVAPEVLRSGFDVVVVGEADEAIRELGEVTSDHRSLAEVDGIVYREGDRIHRTRYRKLIHDLDTTPFPAFDLVNPTRYPFGVFGEGSKVACVETARGCPYACDFCSVTPTWGNKWRNKSNERILEELEIVRRLGYDWIFFTDDIFLVKPNLRQRLALFSEMEERQLRFRFISQMRADVTARNPEVIRQAAAAGLRVAFLGVESGSEEVLRQMHKGLYTADSVRAVRVLHENGIISLCGMMLGAPYESVWDELHTIRFAHELGKAGADAVQFSIYTPLPGTRIFDKAVKERTLFTLDWSRYDILTPVMRTKVNPALTQLIQATGHYSFYFIKWLRHRVRGSPPTTADHERLTHRAEKYLVNNLSLYLGDLVRLPWAIARTHRIHGRGNPEMVSPEQMAELQETSDRLVYDPEGGRNPYFLIRLQPKHPLTSASSRSASIGQGSRAPLALPGPIGRA